METNGERAAGALTDDLAGHQGDVVLAGQAGQGQRGGGRAVEKGQEGPVPGILIHKGADEGALLDQTDEFFGAGGSTGEHGHRGACAVFQEEPLNQGVFMVAGYEGDGDIILDEIGMAYFPIAPMGPHKYGAPFFLNEGVHNVAVFIGEALGRAEEGFDVGELSGHESQVLPEGPEGLVMLFGGLMGEGRGQILQAHPAHFELGA